MGTTKNVNKFMKILVYRFSLSTTVLTIPLDAANASLIVNDVPFSAYHIHSFYHFTLNQAIVVLSKNFERSCVQRF